MAMFTPIVGPIRAGKHCLLKKRMSRYDAREKAKKYKQYAYRCDLCGQYHLTKRKPKRHTTDAKGPGNG